MTAPAVARSQARRGASVSVSGLRFVAVLDTACVAQITLQPPAAARLCALDRHSTKSTGERRRKGEFDAMTALQMTFPIMTGHPRAHSIQWRDLVRSLYARFEPVCLRLRAGGWGLAEAGSDGDNPAGPVTRAKRAVLLIDMVESVRLIEQDEAGIIARWLSFVSHVRTGILPELHGRVVKSLGDGMLLDFEDVRSAAAAAFAIQQAIGRGNAGVPAERQIHLRIGLEVSDVIIGADDIHGRGVNLAARLMTLAGPGEIVVSAHARDQLTADLDADIEDLGDCFVRHIEHPIRAYRIGPPGPRPSVKRIMQQEALAPSVAVIPFSARQVPQEHDALGEVLAEEIIRALSRAANLNVISRLSTTTFRNRLATLDEIGALLNADYVLSGSYSTAGEQVRLDAELAETKSGRVVWTERLRDQVSGILAGEPAIVGRAASEVNAAIVRRELERSQSQPLPTLKSYTLLLAAITLMHRLSLADFERARELLQAVIDRGIRHPIPYSRLAHWHVLRVQQGWSADARQDQYMALECAKRALDLDPNFSLALAIDGLVHTHFLKRPDIATERYDLAIAADSNNGLAWLLRGTQFAFMDEGERAVADTERAMMLSPLDPQRWYYTSLAATACVSARRYESALDLAQRSLRENRKHTSTLRVIVLAQWQLGHHERARESARELMKLEPNFSVRHWLERSPAASYNLGKEFATVLRRVGVPD
jgi:class 3 adenylate cyclase/tetratricopeptide (TPR) repeat protein